MSKSTVTVNNRTLPTTLDFPNFKKKYKATFKKPKYLTLFIYLGLVLSTASVLSFFSNNIEQYQMTSTVIFITGIILCLLGKFLPSKRTIEPEDFLKQNYLVDIHHSESAPDNVKIQYKGGDLFHFSEREVSKFSQNDVLINDSMDDLLTNQIEKAEDFLKNPFQTIINIEEQMQELNGPNSKSFGRITTHSKMILQVDGISANSIEELTEKLKNEKGYTDQQIQDSLKFFDNVFETNINVIDGDSIDQTSTNKFFDIKTSFDAFSISNEDIDNIFDEKNK